MESSKQVTFKELLEQTGHPEHAASAERLENLFMEMMLVLAKPPLKVGLVTDNDEH